MLPKKLPRRLCVPTTSTQALGTSNGNEAPTSQGWAIKGQKTATNTSENVKRFPIAKFNEQLFSRLSELKKSSHVNAPTLCDEENVAEEDLRWEGRLEAESI